MTNAEELKQRNRDRSESEAELSLTQYAVDHCKTAIARIGSSGRILYANEAERQKAAAQLLIQVEGSVLLRSLGLDDVVENAFDG